MDEDKYKMQSKEILKKLCTTKIKTTMIGALDSLEKGLASRLEDDYELRKLFTEIRKEILDKGNKQIRDLESELENYEVKWLRYRTVFKIIKDGQ